MMWLKVPKATEITILQYKNIASIWNFFVAFLSTHTHITAADFNSIF